MNPAERCTPLSVAAHTLYEKSRPDILPGPGGALHLAGAHYEALDDRRTRISGGVFVPTNKYSVVTMLQMNPTSVPVQQEYKVAAYKDLAATA